MGPQLRRRYRVHRHNTWNCGCDLAAQCLRTTFSSGQGGHPSGCAVLHPFGVPNKVDMHTECRGTRLQLAQLHQALKVSRSFTIQSYQYLISHFFASGATSPRPPTLPRTTTTSARPRAEGPPPRIAPSCSRAWTRHGMSWKMPGKLLKTPPSKRRLWQPSRLSLRWEFESLGT